jgi:hypothetical protein
MQPSRERYPSWMACTGSRYFSSAARAVVSAGVISAEGRPCAYTELLGVVAATDAAAAPRMRRRTP